MASNSFDIVSQVDLNEVKNAVNQAQKEVVTRFDLKSANVSVGSRTTSWWSSPPTSSPLARRSTS